MDMQKNLKFKIDLKKKIVLLTVLPVLLVGLIIIFIAETVVRDALLMEITDALKSAATATYAAYDQNPGDYLEAENGDVWKGSYNISKSDLIVDSIKEKSNLEVTFFYGDQRIMTSAKDKDGERILKSPAGEVIKKEVLENGKEYFSSSVSIDGTLHYGYYLPVYQNGIDKPIGMIFVGANKLEKDAVINRIINTVVIVVVLVMIICIVGGVLFAFNLTNPIKKGILMVQSVAMGNLKNEMEDKLLKKNDEIGDLSNSILKLQDEMKKSLTGIAENAEVVTMASEELEETAKETTNSMQQVENAVNSIAESATVQAQISDNASQNVYNMGQKIETTRNEMDQMKVNADLMCKAEEQTVETIRHLLESNKEVQNLITEIAEQTKETNDSVQQINQATEIIASIAEETNLLSLNASIEAARAGESGRGFAVVATEIQKLANQSNESSQSITDILHQLIENSNKAVNTMQRVSETILQQTMQIQQTETMTQEVMQKIIASMQGMEVIGDSIAYLDELRSEIVNTVSELSDIAQQNAATTQEVSATTNNVTENFNLLAQCTEGFKQIATDLEESIKHFDL